MSFLACAVGWSWEINYRFRVPHVDVETTVGGLYAAVMSDADGKVSNATRCQMRQAEASKPSLQMRQGPSGQPVADGG